MRKHAFLHRLLALLTALLLLCAAGSSALAEKVIALNAADYPVTEDGWYLSMEEVAVYLATFDHLPDSFIKKNDAMRLGWDSRSGNLDRVAPGKAIGGDRFGNYEGTLPDQNGRRWTECDVNYDGGYRDSQRIVFSNDGLMYYTNDHYNTFTRIQVSFDRRAVRAAHGCGQPESHRSRCGGGLSARIRQAARAVPDQDRRQEAGLGQRQG